MKFIYIVLLICFNFCFYNLFCTEKPLDINTGESEMSSNVSFDFGNSAGKVSFILGKKSKTLGFNSDSDFNTMLGFYAMGGIGVALTVLFAGGTIVCLVVALVKAIGSLVVSSEAIVATVVAFVALGSLGALIFIAIPFVIIGFAMAKHYGGGATFKRGSTSERFFFQSKIESFDKPEIGFSISL